MALQAFWSYRSQRRCSRCERRKCRLTTSMRNKVHVIGASPAGLSPQAWNTCEHFGLSIFVRLEQSSFHIRRNAASKGRRNLKCIKDLLITMCKACCDTGHAALRVRYYREAAFNGPQTK